MTHPGGRIIDTDTLRISLVLQVSSDDQEHEQGSEDNNPNVNAHQSTSRRVAVKQLGIAAVYAQTFQATCVASDRRSFNSSRRIWLARTHFRKIPENFFARGRCSRQQRRSRLLR